MFDLIQSFHACKQEEGKTVAAYVLKMKGYVDQLERLGYVLPKKLPICINMGKDNCEIHAMLIVTVGHWKRICLAGSCCVAEEEEASWLMTVLRGFRIERKLKQGALYLYVGNGVRAQVEAIGSFDLVLPNGLVICLDNFSKNGVLYFNAVPRNGIYEIDMHDLVPNVNSIYNVSNKRVKHNLDSTYLWHCRLAHINKKRIKQLQQDGLLKVWGCEALVKRDTPDKLEQRSVNLELSWEGGKNLKEIQEEEDTTHSEITSNIPQEVEGFEPPQRKNTKDMFLVFGEILASELRVELIIAMLDSWMIEMTLVSDMICLRFEWRRSGLEELQAKYHCNMQFTLLMKGWFRKRQTLSMERYHMFGSVLNWAK
ncbi:retrotransposon protein, putative, ty1-copia subclass [Tanacetum coccineum]